MILQALVTGCSTTFVWTTAALIWAAVLRDWIRQHYGDQMYVWRMNRRHRRRRSHCR